MWKPIKYASLLLTTPDYREMFIEALQAVDPGCQYIITMDGEEALAKHSNSLSQLPGFIIPYLNMLKISGRECPAVIKKTVRANISPKLFTPLLPKKDLPKAVNPAPLIFFKSAIASKIVHVP